MRPVPRLHLYVEHCMDEEWFVHVGHVANRGRWQIEPHTHPESGRLIFVRERRGVITLEGTSVPFAGPCAMLLPTDCVHGLDGSAAALEALLSLLLLTLIRAMPTGKFEHDYANPANVRQTERFRELVNQHYGKNLRLQEYASMMALSVSQLRSACASGLGQSPTKIIHSRIVTEAKRSLIFGDLPVEQIAFRLGFDDAAYFTRFFRREVGQTPSQFQTTSKN